jgi:cytochrome b6
VSPLVAARRFLEERIDLTPFQHVVEKKRVPIHRNSIWYYFGGITLFLLIVQIVTGILLLLYYRPSAEEAYESVQFLMTRVSYGWLFRSLHSWSANLLIGAAFIHLFSTFLMKAYRKPREITWVTGSILFYLLLGFGFSGYLLPWNEIAFFATKVGTDIAGQVPFVGHTLLTFLRGGPEVTGATLTRFFGFHVALLPALLTALLLVHLYLVQMQGMSVPLGVLRKHGDPARVPSMRFVPNFALRDLVFWLGALVILGALSSLFPWELGEKADPYAPAPAGIRPEWYFVFLFETLKHIPSRILGLEGEMLGILAMMAGGALVPLVPFLDRKSSRGEPSPLFTAIGVLAIAYVVSFTVLSYALPTTR